MLTWVITFFLLALVAGTVGMIAAGPVGLILFVVFLAAAVWSLIQYMRERRQR
ncbi:MAG TPA: hypothetical protein VD965_09375 [Burkholderiales bacterium]|nr:hypothetical protein [Burkholderiales bacterium]